MITEEKIGQYYVGQAFFHREVRRKNQIYFEEVIDSLITQLNDLMTSYDNIDHVKQSLHKLVVSYSDFSCQFDNQEQTLDDAGFLCISTEMRNAELLHDLSLLKMQALSILSLQSLQETQVKVVSQSHLVYQVLQWTVISGTKP